MNKQRFMTTVDKPHVVKNSHAKLLIFWNDDNSIAGVGPRYGHEWIKLLEPITNVNISHKNN